MTLIPSTLERIRRHLVGLRMPRAQEALDGTVRQLERGEFSALEGLEALLGEELTLRKGRRINAALKIGRLINIKTLEGFDFSFQPSLDRNRILTLAQLDFIARREVLHFLGQPGCGKTHLALALGVEAVKGGHSVYFMTLADLITSLAKAQREGNLRERLRFLCRPQLLIVDEIGYLPVIPGGGNLFFQLVNAPLRTRRHDPHLKPWLCRMVRGLQRPRRRHRPSGSRPASCHRRPHRGRQLSPAPSCPLDPG